MKKRILSFLVVLVMAIGFLPTAAFAIEVYESGDWVYFVDGDYVKINNYRGTDANVVVPAVIDGLNITHIHSCAFYNNDYIESVTISDGIEYIGSSAFSDCELLNEVIIPSSVTHIGDMSLSHCPSLTQIEIPYGVEFVGYAAFYNTPIETIVFPESVTRLGANLFQDSTTLKTVYLPRSVTDIGNYAFSGCDNITKVYYAGNRIEYFNLSNTPECENVEYAITHYTFDINDTITAEINEQTGKLVITGSGVVTASIPYYLNDLVTDIEISQGITALDREAFRYFRSLKTITLPATITSIGTDAFEYTSKLERVDFGGTLEQYNAIEIGEYNGYFTSADTYCDGVHIHYFDDDTDPTCNGCDYMREKLPTASGSCGDDVAWAFDADTGTLTISGTGYMYHLFTSPWEQYKSQITTVVINEGVTSIGGYAFSYCSSLTSINIPDSVTSIGDSAFRGCSGLTSITIPEGVTLVDRDAFNGCSGLTSIIIPEGVTSIGYYAFFECRGLESITIPSSVTSIGQMAFYGCYNIKKVHITSIETWLKINFNSMSDNPLYNGADLYLNNSLVTEVIVPESITEIKNNAFSGCESLTSITIPDSVTSIGNGAFCECSSLESITIPEGVTSIGNMTFYNCSSLTSITIPSSLTSIGYIAFEGCFKIKKVFISNIEAWLKINFDTLASNPLCSGGVNLYLNNTLVTKVVVPESITEINDCAFYGCSSLASITIPNSVTSIGEWAFDECSSLKKIALSTGMTMIEGRTFSGSGIKVLYLPKEITLIKGGAFNNTNINYVYYSGTEADRENLKITSNNDSLENATWVYNATGLPACEYTNNCDSQCNLCGETRQVEGHKYTNACDTSCNVCGASRTTTHSFGAYIYNNNATTSADGTKTRTCSVCGHSETVVEVGSKLPAIQDTTKIFTDVAKDWYTQYVDYAYSYGIFKGNEDGTFKPLANITRAEFVQVLANITNINTSNKAVVTKFLDVKAGDWFAPAVKWANDNGIVAGYGAEFKPQNNITREQMCVMIVNYAKYRGIALSVVEARETFADDYAISSWAKDAVYACQMADIVNGKGGGRFDPAGTGLRAEASVIFTKFHQSYLR